MRYLYPVKLDREGGVYLVSCPDLPEVNTFGANRKEALLAAEDAVEEVLAHRLTHGQAIPAPSPAKGRPVVGPGVIVAAKLALAEAIAESKLSKAALARRLGLDEAEVRRLLNPRHKSKLDRIDQAISALNRRLVIDTRPAA